MKKRSVWMCLAVVGICAILLVSAPAKISATECVDKIEYDMPIETEYTDCSQPCDLLEWAAKNSSITFSERGERVSQSDYENAKKVILQGIKEWSTEINIAQYNIPTEYASSLYNEVRFENPQLFYAGAYSYRADENSITQFIIIYDTEYTKKDVEEYELKIAEIISKIPDNMEQEEIALFLHDYLVSHCEYDKTLSNFDAYSALVLGNTVCQGYTLGYADLLNRCGIENKYVSNIIHAWNLVCIDGSWYHVDTTWDDPVDDLLGYVKHTNFLRSDEGITETGHYDWEISLECTDTKYDTYYWSDIKSAICFEDADTSYYMFDGILYQRESNVVQQISNSAADVWYVWGDNSLIWSKSNSLLLKENSLYYNGNDTLYVYDLLEKEERIFCKYTNGNGYIYGLAESLDGNEILLEIRTSPATEEVERVFLGDAIDPEIVSQPTNQFVQENEYASFLVTARGKTLTYQWQYSPRESNIWKNCNIDSSITPTLKIEGTDESNRMKYRCIITNEYGTEVISNEVTLTVTDSSLEDFVIEKGIFVEYKGTDSNVVIPEGVTEIRKNAFFENTIIKKVVIPDSVTKIGMQAFCGCSNLKEITLSKEITILEKSVFYNCGNLMEIKIPESVTEIKTNAFFKCVSLQKAEMSDNVKTIGNSAFHNCSRLEEMQLSDKLEVIGEYVFAGCSNLQKIEMSDNVKIIENSAFRDCSRLEKIKLSNGITSIEDFAFSACKNLKEIKLPDNLVNFGKYVFWECSSLEEIKISEYVTNIGYATFAYCTNLAKAVIPNSVKMIEDFAFHKVSDNFTIYGYENSYIQQYAKEHKIPFVDLEKEEKPLNKNTFTDVLETEYYYQPVLWALENNITVGINSTTFAPEASCTRGQVVTFLWRAMGCPEPTTTTNPFVDVPEYEYYYKAVLWALENGITVGINATQFAPDQTVTRGQFVTFLYRAENKPSYTVNNPFSDVPNTYYYDAVLWAYENGVTTGMDSTHFSPEDSCTRGQVVTFLYRALNEKEN